MTLPEPSQIELSGDFAVQPRHERFLDESVAAQALQGFAGEQGPALADPVLGHRRGDAAKAGLALVRAVVGSGQPHGQHGGRLGFDAQVGQHVLHQRLIDQQVPEGLAMPRVMGGLHQGLAHQGGRAQRAIQPRVVDHLENRAHAAPFLAQQRGLGVVELDFARGVRAIAQLVLQPLQEEIVARAFAASSAAAENTTVRRVPGPAPETRRTSAPSRTICGRSADIPRPARPCRPARPAWCWRARRSRLAFRSWPCQSARPTFRPPGESVGRSACWRSAAPRFAPASVLPAQRRHGGIGHRDRAAVACFVLRRHVEQRRAGDVRAVRESRQGRLCKPCDTLSCISACQAGWNRTSSIRRPRASCVCSTGGLLLASKPQLITASVPNVSPSEQACVAHPSGALALDRLAQRRVAGEQVVSDQLRCLILNFVRRHVPQFR